MAKAPTAKASETPTPAPSQPWSPPAPAADSATSADGGNGGGTPPVDNAESAPAPASTGDTPQDAPFTPTEVPSTSPESIPGVDAPAEDVDVANTHDQAAKLAEHDVASTAPGTELPSQIRDQISPSGVDIALEADRSVRPDLERSAYPSVGERVRLMLDKTSPEIREKFEQLMSDAAEAIMDELASRAMDNEVDGLLIDGTTHYGPKIRTDAAKKDEASDVSKAELNRRARRAAERVAAIATKK